MADDASEESDAPAEESADEAPDGEDSDGESKSFRERVEEIRQQRAEEGDDDGEGVSREEKMEEMMGGGGPPGMGGGPGGRGEEESTGDEELTREVRKLRDEVHDVRRTLDRIADALED